MGSWDLGHFADPKFHDWRRPSCRILVLRQFVKILLFHVLNDTIKNSSRPMNKTFYVHLESYSLLCIVICILAVTALFC